MRKILMSAVALAILSTAACTQPSVEENRYGLEYRENAEKALEIYVNGVTGDTSLYGTSSPTEAVPAGDTAYLRWAVAAMEPLPISDQREILNDAAEEARSAGRRDLSDELVRASNNLAGY